ncbi:MAG: hydrogenase iron-sulfur subunit [Nitrospinae bacterium]|nr:hydrogenase iron-sulfur subunit [Nitrospinota bacterium]
MNHKNLSIKKRIVYTVEGLADRIFTPRYNPLYYLGMICFFLLTLIAISGIYLFFFYRTSDPYEAIQSLTVNQWYAGGILRSVHRYASDGLILFLIIHLLREFLLGRYRQWRWLSWVSGNALLIASIAMGIIGYFLVWDERAQLIAIRTAHLLDDIPLFIEPPPRTFLSIATMSKMLFFVLLIGHAMISLIGMGTLTVIHISRNARPAIKPPRAVAAAILIILLLLSFISPATNALPVDMAKIPVDTPFDWFYLFIYPLSSILSRGAFWLMTVGGIVILFMAPWLGSRSRQPIAQIKSENCVGCEQCRNDCPYEAIKMIPRKDGRPYLFQAEVMKNRCAGCGICVGACGSNGPDLPNLTMEQIKEEVTKLLYLSKKPNGRPNIVGLVCEKSVREGEFIDTKNRSLNGMPDVSIVTFPCIGMVNHSVIEYALESGADGVFISGCQTGECHYREGSKWTQMRLRTERAPVPVLKGDIDYSRVRSYYLSPLQTNSLIKEIGIFQGELNNRPNNRRYNIVESVLPKERTYGKAVKVFTAAVLLIPAVLILFLSVKPIYPFYNKDMSLIKFTFKHASRHEEEQRELTAEESEKKLKHMRRSNSPFAKVRRVGKRERLPVYVEMELDDKKILSKTYYPTGIRNDGPAFAYEEMLVPPGVHYIKVGMRDSKDENHFDYTHEDKIELKPGKITIINFVEETEKGAVEREGRFVVK